MSSSEVSRRRSIIATSAAIALLSIGATACGGGDNKSDNPATSIAVKNGRPTPASAVPSGSGGKKP